MCEGQVVDGKYHLLRLLGTGSYGGVFQADEVVADRLIRQVAVKLIEPDEADPDGQMQELIAAANLDHACLLRCYTPGQCQLNGLSLLYMVTELAQETLEARLETGPLTLEEAFAVARSVVAALGYLHGQSSPLVHQDVKPGNILRSAGCWKLGDFGLLRPADAPDSARSTGNLVGTAAYAPPESYEGHITSAWDVWSLGVTLAEALTGSLPFTGQTPHQLMIAIASQEPNLATSLPEPFDEIVRGCLRKDPQTRWTISQVAAALHHTAAASAVSTSNFASAPLSADFYARLSAAKPAADASPVTADVTVAATGPGDYRSIGEALQCAPRGARLRVRPGLYNEQIVLDRPVEICGEGDVGEIVVENIGAACLVMQTPQATVRGLTFISRAGTPQRKHPAVEVPTGTLTLEDCVLSCTSTTGAAVHGAESELRLHRCHLQDGKTGGLAAYERGRGLLEACEISGNFGAGVEAREGGVVTLHGCTLHDGQGDGVRVQSGGQATAEECMLSANAGIGIDAEGGKLILRHCQIQENRQAGVSFRRDSEGTVEDCRIAANVLSNLIVTQVANPSIVRCKILDGHSNGVWVAESGQGVFEDCEIANNAFAGVKISQGGNPVLRRSTLQGGKRTGVTVHAKGRGTLVDCELHSNTHANILVEAGGKLMARRCLIHDGKECGLLVSGEGTFEECDFYSNAQSAVEVTQGGNPVLRGCTLRDGHFLGLLVQGKSQARAEDCTIAAHRLPGVAVGEESTLWMRHCRIVDGQQVGLVFWGASEGRIEDCEISGNALGGIVIRQGADPRVHACQIVRNGQFGVTALEQGAGTITDCDLRENAHGAFSVEAGCTLQGGGNILPPPS
jgi:nitrous oxidase accessory protein NosD